MPATLFLSAIFIILFVLFIYWVLWRLWLLLEDNVLQDYDFWNKVPGAVRRPKFWQFAILMFLWTTHNNR